MTDTAPKIENAPGIRWRKRAQGRWAAIWQARADLVAKGFRPREHRIWVGTHEDMKPAHVLYIQDRANRLQAEMLAFGRGGTPAVPGIFDGTIAMLAQAYQNDQDSPYAKTRYVSRQYYDHLLKTIVADHGHELICEIKGRTVLRWHEEWSKPKKGSDRPKTAMAHALVGMLRTIINFGVTFMEDEDCLKLSIPLTKLRFKMAKPRSERLSAEQVIAIRAKAHEMGWHSIALAQAIQFECILRQKDVLGEWVPIDEPGVSAMLKGNQKWLRGIRWDEIDENLVLRHITSKRQKPIEVPLKNAPMVMEEFAFLGDLPKSGPVIIQDRTEYPWDISYFRGRWRAIATACDIPSTVRNMDSRAGAISEALDAEANPNKVRLAATHSQLEQTMSYSRANAETAGDVLRIRVEGRNKKGTQGS